MFAVDSIRKYVRQQKTEAKVKVSCLFFNNTLNLFFCYIDYIKNHLFNKTYHEEDDVDIKKFEWTPKAAKSIQGEIVDNSLNKTSGIDLISDIINGAIRKEVS